MPKMNGDGVQEILALEEQRCAAMIAADIGQLDRLIGDDLHYVHGSSRLDTKQSFLESLRSGTIRFRGIDRTDVEVRVYNGCAAVVTGAARMNVRSKGEDKEIRIRFTNVWARRDAQTGPWQWMTWHATKIP